MQPERILFVTGRLAEAALRSVVDDLAGRVGFSYEIAQVGVNVAALMNCQLVARRLQFEGRFDRLILPGWCQGDLHALASQFEMRVERGPIDLFDLPEYFGRGGRQSPDLSQFDIEILAEINHAPRLSEQELMDRAGAYRDHRADVIDLGCVPGESWLDVGDAVRRLRGEGFRVSIDSFDRREVEDAVEAGAELVLSCNSSNVDWLSRLPAALVAIPDTPPDLDSLDELAGQLQAAARPHRLDPILEPVGFGFAASLARYFETRKRHPAAAMLMGVGNVTELSEVDSAGVNFLLAAVCQELRIGSVLTTEVARWCRSAVREFDAARRMAKFAIDRAVLPKSIGGDLVLLGDRKRRDLGDEALRSLAGQISDPNFRIFAERGEIHTMNRDGYWHGDDPYELFDRLLAEAGAAISPEHAFYLGYELCKARTALTLDKTYRQDEALRWGFLTRDETSALERRHKGDSA